MIVVSSFNTECLKDPLQFLIDHFMEGEKVNVVYGNVQRLLMDLKNTKENQIVTVLFRLVDLEVTTDLELQTSLSLLIDAIDVVKRKFAAHLVVLLCPSFEYSQDFKLLEEIFYNEMQRKSIELVKVIDIQTYYSLSPTEIQVDKELDIPYSSKFYTALGCSIVRKLHNLVSVPYKVIVVDSDNTLWDGALDDLGAEKINFKEHHCLLQEFLIKRINAGMLICLSSKNEDQHRVNDVFEKRAEMRLKLEHLSKIKINSQLTSENISRIVNELNLGLENFVLISSSAADIEEVQDNLPGVVCIKAPENIQELIGVQDHWVFDSKIATKEDRNRSKFYKEDDLRQEYLSSFDNYIEAIESLDLSLFIDKIREDQEEIIKRISVLSGRTNQFNLFPITKDVADIKNSLREFDNAVFAVHASDRFGNFGLIGVAFCRVQAQVLYVDSYFVSCRAFKKGIEYAVIKYIAQYAVKESLDLIKLKFKRTEKNAAALSFITILMRKFSNLKDEVYQIEIGKETNITFLSHLLAKLDEVDLLDSQIKEPIKIVTSSSDVIKHSLRVYSNRNLNKLHSMTQSLNFLSEKFFPS